jgi:hypothetical protein
MIGIVEVLVSAPRLHDVDRLPPADIAAFERWLADTLQVTRSALFLWQHICTTLKVTGLQYCTYTIIIPLPTSPPSSTGWWTLSLSEPSKRHNSLWGYKNYLADIMITLHYCLGNTSATYRLISCRHRRLRAVAGGHSPSHTNRTPQQATKL